MDQKLMLESIYKSLEENEDGGINIIKRTLENNTHEVISDMKLKK